MADAVIKAQYSTLNVGLSSGRLCRRSYRGPFGMCVIFRVCPTFYTSGSSAM
jgi:hypothetical protein